MLGRLALLEQYTATNRFRAGRPTQITVAPDGRSIYFLRSGGRDVTQDLYEHDVATGQERRLLAARDVLSEADEHLDAEERARRERMRAFSRGFGSFELSEKESLLLAVAGQRLFLLDRHSGDRRELNTGGESVLDPRLSPDGAKIAFVRKGDVYVADLHSNAETRLTHTAKDDLTNGLAEFVAQEEMHRMQGYWWSPDSAMLAYQETDVSEAPTRHISDPFHPARTPAAWRYPNAGATNARVRLGLTSTAGGSTTWVSWDANHYPYLATVKWPKGGPLLILVQNRTQTEEVLLRVDPQTGATTPLLVETDAEWLNLDQSFPHWVDESLGFLWMTERLGARQLELRTVEGAPQHMLTSLDDGFRKLLHVDKKARIAWILAGSDPTRATLASVSLEAPYTVLHHATDAPADHSETVFGKENDIVVHHTAEGPTSVRWAVKRRTQGALGAATSELRSAMEAPVASLQRELVTVGMEPELHASLVRPADFQPGKKYPVLVLVYGGPGAQIVKIDRTGYLLDQWMANQGFIVVSIDGRGTPARNRAFERVIKGDFATLPLEDQVRGLTALGRRFPELDLGRVGIFGWSFGGYMSAMSVMRRPDVFHAGVCGAPVNDFRDYDTHYSERYLGLPDISPAAYDVSCINTYARQLIKPLLLIHGTADDNCYFSGTLSLSNALFRAGVDHEFLPLAGETHMVTNPEVVCAMHERMIRFFQKSLG